MGLLYLYLYLHLNHSATPELKFYKPEHCTELDPITGDFKEI
jgi:hypothetical protein